MNQEPETADTAQTLPELYFCPNRQRYYAWPIEGAHHIGASLGSALARFGTTFEKADALQYLHEKGFSNMPVKGIRYTPAEEMLSKIRNTRERLVFTTEHLSVN